MLMISILLRRKYNFSSFSLCYNNYGDYFMRRFLISILSTLLVLSISILIINMNFKNTLISGLLLNNFKSVFQDSNIDIDTSELINDNSEVLEIFGGFMDTVMEEVDDKNIDVNKIDDYDLEGKTIDFINNNRDSFEKYGIDVDDQKIQEFSSKIKDSNISESVKKMVNNTKNEMPPGVQKIIKVYKIITSTSLKNILIISIIVNSLLIIILSFSLYKWMKPISVSMIFGGLIPIGISYITDKLTSSFFEFNIDINPIIKVSGIVTIIGIVLLIVYFVINSSLRRKVDEIS